MTIVAASGVSANVGLPGVRPGSRGIPVYPVIALGVPFGLLRSRPTFQSALFKLTCSNASVDLPGATALETMSLLLYRASFFLLQLRLRGGGLRRT